MIKIQNAHFKYFILSLVLIIISAGAAYLYFKPVINSEQLTFVRYDDLDTATIPKQIKNLLLSKAGSELNLIYFDGSDLFYHEEFKGDITTVLYLNAMKKLAASPQHALLKGYYLISFRDGVHESFASPWPVLAFAAEIDLVQNKKVILTPDLEAMRGYNDLFAAIDSKLDQYPWNKKIAKIFWRGAASGTKYNNTDMDGSPRLKLMNAASKLKIADVGFTGSPLFFNDEFRNKFERTYKLKPTVKPEDSIAYKYLIDVDGNSCAFSRMAWILYSNSLLMKHKSTKIQWYYDKLKPYVNYVPIATDFSDLESQFNWAQAHQTEAEAIALNSRKLAQEIFSDENILQSLEQALLRYNAAMKEIDGNVIF